MHPRNALFKQAQAGMQAIDVKYGRTSDHQTDNAAGHVALKAQCAGMQCIDHLVLGGTSGDRIIAVQGKLGSGLSKVVSVDTVEALNTPLTQSSQASAEVHAQQQGQQAQQEVLPVRAQEAPAMSR
ncbi:XVIPCD domain-containing protein [Variovorax sp. CCNWLW235]|uniref:XVIPCD domain-containing protein n=1 Tax=Variovorax sp. CCNWLW235 TaxID=3127463 RepID=UPI003076CE3B